MSCEAEARKRVIYRVTFVGFVVNLVLTAMKFAAGIAGRSGAMVADAVHSCSDMLTDIVVIAFAKVSAKPRDDGHDYGHGKYETLATIIISLALAAVGAGILLSSTGPSHRRRWRGVARPGAPWLWPPRLCRSSSKRYYTDIRCAKGAGSKARAWSPMPGITAATPFRRWGPLAGIGCAYFLGQRWRIADPIAALVVAVFIFKIAFDLIRTGLGELLERSLPDETEREILGIVTADPRVGEPHQPRTRRIGAAIAVEVPCPCGRGDECRRSHELTVDIERRLRARFGEGTIISIHVEPAKCPSGAEIPGVDPPSCP